MLTQLLRQALFRRHAQTIIAVDANDARDPGVLKQLITLASRHHVVFHPDQNLKTLLGCFFSPRSLVDSVDLVPLLVAHRELVFQAGSTLMENVQEFLSNKPLVFLNDKFASQYLTGVIHIDADETRKNLFYIYFKNKESQRVSHEWSALECLYSSSGS